MAWMSIHWSSRQGWDLHWHSLLQLHCWIASQIREDPDYVSWSMIQHARTTHLNIGFKLIGQFLEALQFLRGQCGHIQGGVIIVVGIGWLGKAVREKDERRGRLIRMGREILPVVGKMVVRIEMIPGYIRHGHHQQSKEEMQAG